MTPRQAQIALASFVLLAAGVIYNALYRQSEASQPRVAAVSRVEPAPSARPRTSAATTKRTGQLKPDSATTGDGPQVATVEAGPDTVRAIQRELSLRGFGPLTLDGVLRPATRAAIMSYEHDHRLPLTGEATEALLARLVLGAPGTPGASGTSEPQSPHAEAIIKQVQRLLAASGYRPGAADGRLSAETIAAIRAYEQDQGLSPKGRISVDVLTRLQNGSARQKSAEVR